MRDIPDELRAGPFLRSRALELGVTAAMLRTSRFRRLYPRVWCVADPELTATDRRAAAALALPAGAALTGISRIQELDLDFGPAEPVHFVIEGERHLGVDGIFLHRTVMMPPLIEGQVSPAAAYLCYLSGARVIDAIQVGDWLLHHGHMQIADLATFVDLQPWRDGSREAAWILEHLDGRSRSLKESETRSLLTFAGLPEPDVNLEVDAAGGVAIGDLVWAAYRLVVEYEGEHHQTDRDQYTSDIARYQLLRDSGVGYLQVTKEDLSKPRRLVERVHGELVARGYAGPEPCFGPGWRRLFRPVSEAVGPRRVPLGRLGA